MGGKTNNTVFQLILLQCCKTSVNDVWNKSYMNCGNGMKMKKWSSQMQLRKEAWKKKNQDFNGVWSRDLTIPVRFSTNWAMKPLTLRAGQLWVHMFPWKQVTRFCCPFLRTFKPHTDPLPFLKNTMGYGTTGSSTCFPLHTVYHVGQKEKFDFVGNI